MLNELSIKQLQDIGKRFRKTVSVFTEEDAGFKPQEDVFSVAYTIAHAGESLIWLVGGAFRPEGFDTDIEFHKKRVEDKTALAAALEHFDTCLADSIALLETKSDEDLLATLPEGDVFGGLPRVAVIEALSDHTASHRGTLGAYARMLGKKPPMPYV